MLSIAALLFFLTGMIRALTPAEVDFGKADGFTGGTTTHDERGDYLTSTFCFCADPTPKPRHYSEAHYFQFEYYNSHQNTTFILDHLCLADQDDRFTCLASRRQDGIKKHNGIDWAGPLCRTWYGSEDTGGVSPHRTKDRLCYEQGREHDDAWRQWEMPGPDVLEFNGQRRKLGSTGGQGPVLKGLQEAEGTCAWLCDEHAGMEVVTGNELVQCHVVVYEDLDDMCPLCL